MAGSIRRVRGGPISPASRHVGQDHDILEARHRLYSEARQRNLRRWSGNTRNWTPVAAVTLNPSAKQSSRGRSGQLTKIGKPREEEATSILTRTGS